MNNQNYTDEFEVESLEALEKLESDLMDLEKDLSNQDIIQDVFRLMHTLKGSGGMFGFVALSELAHSMETIFDSVRSGEVAMDAQIMELSYFCIDHFRNLIRDKEMLSEELRGVHSNILHDVEAYIASSGLQKKSSKGIKKSTEAPKELWMHIKFVPSKGCFLDGAQPVFLVLDCLSLGEGVAIINTKNMPEYSEFDATLSYLRWDIFLKTSMGVQNIEDLFVFMDEGTQVEVTQLDYDERFESDTFKQALVNLQKEGMGCSLNDIFDIRDSISKVGEGAALSGSREIEIGSASKNGNQSSAPLVKKNVQKRESVISNIRVDVNKLDDLIGLVSELVTVQARLTMLVNSEEHPELMAVSEEVEKISRRLRENAFSISMVALATLETRFQRLVRDIANSEKKKVNLVTQGLDTELDKSLIERIIPPLLHVFRNAVDHGIETPERRREQGKDETGTVTMKASYSGAHVVLQVSDDGNGVNIEKVLKKARKLGFVKPDARPLDKDLLEFLFHPGFSTAEKVTDVSGRGVGMDVVRTALAEMRGEATIASVQGKGTTVTLRLPLTLSILDGLLVNIDDQKFIIPLQYVDKCYEIPSWKSDEVDDVVVLDGQQVPVIDLRNLFSIEGNRPAISALVLVHYESKKVGLIVDHIIGEHQAVLKSLGKIFSKVQSVSGATILGDGQIALIFDVNRIISEFIETYKHAEEMA